MMSIDIFNSMLTVAVAKAPCHTLLFLITLHLSSLTLMNGMRVQMTYTCGGCHSQLPQLPETGVSATNNDKI